MKNKLMSLGIALTLLCGCTIAYAIVVGIEPPATYINNLKTCTKSTIKQNGTEVQEYTIKGLLPNGRCEVYMSSYTNYADPKVYEGFKNMTKAFTNSVKEMSKDNTAEITDSDIPSQQEMIEQGKKEKLITVCKFSKAEREALFNAYQKHDSKNPPAQVKDDSVKVTFSTSNMSSYDKLMIKLNNGPCTTYEAKDFPSANKTKKYVCEYADTTCYWTDLGNGASEMSCTNENKTISNLKLMDKVEQHVRAGMCQQI